MRKQTLTTDEHNGIMVYVYSKQVCEFYIDEYKKEIQELEIKIKEAKQEIFEASQKLPSFILNEVYLERENSRAQLGLRLQELKEMDYTDYLLTPEWDITRKKLLRRADYKCQLCNASATTLNVHHKTYERLGEENDDDLIVLCADCHAKYHDK